MIKAKQQGHEESIDTSKLEEQYEMMLDQNAPNIEQPAAAGQYYGTA